MASLEAEERDGSGRRLYASKAMKNDTPDWNDISSYLEDKEEDAGRSILKVILDSMMFLIPLLIYLYVRGRLDVSFLWGHAPHMPTDML